MAKTSSETQRRKSRAARKGKWPLRGTGTTVLTYPFSAPGGPGKADENGQNSGEMGGSSAWTRPSAPGCGDTLKALAGDQRPIWGGDRPRRRLRGSLSSGSPAGRAPSGGVLLSWTFVTARQYGCTPVGEAADWYARGNDSKLRHRASTEKQINDSVSDSGHNF